MAMTHKQLKAIRRRKDYERRHNIIRNNKPEAERVPLHNPFSLGSKRPYRLYYI